MEPHYEDDAQGDLSPRMCETLTTLHAVTTDRRRWLRIDGLNVHKGSIYALERRGLVCWNSYYQRAALTDAGLAMFERGA